MAGAVGLSFATMALVHPARPEPSPGEWLALDDNVRGRLSTSMSRATDITLLATALFPVGVGIGHGLDTPSANATLFYGEVLTANLLVNTVVKYTVPRLRPYNYCVPPATAYVDSQGVDACLSFYSGHASTAFAAAVGGSYLFTAAHPDSAMNPWLWGIESALATATAVGRIRAGKHFYSDVAVGLVVGSAIGVGIPLLEGVHRSPSATEMAFAGGGVLLGGFGALVAPFHDDAPAPLAAARFRFDVLPSFTQRTVGLSAIGTF